MAFDSIVPDSFPNLYSDQWRLGLQQLTSRLDSYVNTEMVNGEGKRFQKLAPFDARQITTRFGDTNPDDLDIEFRWLYVNFKDSAHRVDRREAMQLGSIGSPHSAILRQQLAAAGRDRDKTLIDGIRGTVQGGKTGGTAIPFDSDQNIAVNFKHTGTPANSGMTFDKIIEISRLFGVNNVTGQDNENQSAGTIILSYNQIADLLHEEKFTSADFSEIRRLHSGQVINLMGLSIKAVSADLLPYNAGTDVRTCYAFARNSVVFGIAENPMSWVDEMPDKKHDIQLRTEWGWGCTRLDEEGVVAIACDESP
jgi:hypothetical protein